MNNRDDWRERFLNECGLLDLQYPGEFEKAVKFIQAELNKVREEGARAGLQEGMEGVIGLILEELDIAEQDKEMAENPDDPKIRIAYLRGKLLRISLAEKE